MGLGRRVQTSRTWEKKKKKKRKKLAEGGGTEGVKDNKCYCFVITVLLFLMQRLRLFNKHTAVTKLCHEYEFNVVYDNCIKINI